MVEFLFSLLEYSSCGYLLQFESSSGDDLFLVMKEWQNALSFDRIGDSVRKNWRICANPGTYEMRFKNYRPFSTKEKEEFTVWFEVTSGDVQFRISETSLFNYSPEISL